MPRSSKTRLLAWLAGALLIMLAVPVVAAASDSPPTLHQLLGNRRANLTTTIDRDNVDTMARVWFLRTKAPVSGTPLCYGRSVIVADWSGRVARVQRGSGRVVWKRALGSPSTALPVHGFAGTGTIIGNTLIEASVEGMAWGLDVRSGRTLWKTRVGETPDEGSLGDLLAWDGLVYIGVSSVDELLSTKAPGFVPVRRGSVVALNVKTGATVWRSYSVDEPTTGGSVGSSFALRESRDRLYFTTGSTYLGSPSPTSDALLCVKASTGELIWRAQVTATEVWAPPAPFTPEFDFGSGPQLFTAQYHDGTSRGLVGVGQKSGTYWAFDATTGERVWHKAIGSGPSGMTGEASIGGAHLYVWSNAGWEQGKAPGHYPVRIMALDNDDGDADWVRAKPQPAMGGTAGFMAKSVYFTGDLLGNVRAYCTCDGGTLWRGTTFKRGAVASSLWAQGSFLFVGSRGPSGLNAYRLR